ncbi:unnamed protein product [Miscanthus lutarioriparius]|uniref:Uncharacterized protein n=1 Tax=Miscanthus lutarioriparius TaxID=422564 RepID=A0A811QB93_9POAL|nr:unnamed protein product [Miscanthus lutarioriparius]
MASSPAPRTTPSRSSPWQYKAHTGAPATKPTDGISEKVAANHHQKTTSAILVQAAPVNIPRTKKTSLQEQGVFGSILLHKGSGRSMAEKKSYPQLNEGIMSSLSKRSVAMHLPSMTLR